MMEHVLGPRFDDYVIKELQENFPPCSPLPDDTMEKIMYQSGQRSVVEWLINRLNEENNG